MMDN